MADPETSRAVVRPEDLIALQPFTEQEDARRFSLKGIFVEPCPDDGAALAASDGKRLAIRHDPNALVEGLPQIWRANWKRLLAEPMKRAVQELKHAGDTWCELTWTAETGGLLRVLRIKGAPAETAPSEWTEVYRAQDPQGPDTITRDASLRIPAGAFPEYLKALRAMPATKEAPHLWLKASYLKDAGEFAMAMAWQPAAAAAVTLVALEGNAVLARVQGRGDAVLVIMGLDPTRHSELPTGYPEWLQFMIENYTPEAALAAAD